MQFTRVRCKRSLATRRLLQLFCRSCLHRQLDPEGCLPFLLLRTSADVHHDPQPEPSTKQSERGTCSASRSCVLSQFLVSTLVAVVVITGDSSGPRDVDASLCIRTSRSPTARGFCGGAVVCRLPDDRFTYPPTVVLHEVCRRPAGLARWRLVLASSHRTAWLPGCYAQPQAPQGLTFR